MEEILRAENIIKSFGEKQVLGDISISLGKGEIISLLGPSGIGKTTLFNILAGIISPDSGHVFLSGEDVTGMNGRVSYMLQKDMLLPHKTIIDNVALPLIISGMKKKEAREKAAKYFEEFGLAGEEKNYPSELSGGMRQRAALLRTYLMGNEVVLLDEPFSALDSFNKEKMQEWYLAMKEKLGLSTIFITHDIDEALLISDRIYLLNGSPAQVTEEMVIDIPKPRGRETVTENFFVEYKKKIRQLTAG